MHDGVHHQQQQQHQRQQHSAYYSLAPVDSANGQGSYFYPTTATTTTATAAAAHGGTGPYWSTVPSPYPTPSVTTPYSTSALPPASSATATSGSVAPPPPSYHHHHLHHLHPQQSQPYDEFAPSLPPLPSPSTAAAASRTDVAELLHNLDLIEYLQVLLHNGFDTITALADIQEEDFEYLGIKRGHRRLLRRELATLRGVPNYVPISISGQVVEDEVAPPPVDVVAQPHQSINTSSFPSGGGTVQQINRNTFYLTAPSANAAPPHHHHHHQLAPITSSTTANTHHSAGGDQAHQKRRYRRHPKVDPHAPVKPVSAYVEFSNLVREEMKGASFTEIARRVGERWQALPKDEKERLEAKAAADKDAYIQASADYKRTSHYAAYQQYLVEFKKKYPSALLPDSAAASLPSPAPTPSVLSSISSKAVASMPTPSSSKSMSLTPPSQQPRAPSNPFASLAHAAAAAAEHDFELEAPSATFKAARTHPRAAAESVHGAADTSGLRQSKRLRTSSSSSSLASSMPVSTDPGRRHAGELDVEAAARVLSGSGAAPSSLSVEPHQRRASMTIGDALKSVVDHHHHPVPRRGSSVSLAAPPPKATGGAGGEGGGPSEQNEIEWDEFADAGET